MTSNGVPIRLRIAGLTAAALVVSMCAILLAGSRHVIDDKTSYVIDHNFGRVKNAADALDHQISESLLMMRLAQEKAATDPASIDVMLRDLGYRTGMKKMLMFQSVEGNLGNPKAFGGARLDQVNELDTLGWTLKRFQAEPFLVGKSRDGEVMLGAWVPSQKGGAAFVGFFQLQLNLAEQGPRFDVFVIDAIGNSLYSKATATRPIIHESQMKKFLKPVLEGVFNSGARTWTSGSDEFIVGYQRLKSHELMVVGIIPYASAFAVVTGLIFRTVVLGLSILAIALGITLIWLKKVTGGLRRMSEAALEVSQGKFDVKIDTRSLPADEVGQLAVSFNTMASKIDDLMKQTVSRVETKNQKDTVSQIQTRLLPDKALLLPNVTLSGGTYAAGQCGGDWWNYAHVRDYAIFVVGKVPGKGLPAALLTAAAHGAFSTFVGAAQLMARIPPSMKLLIGNLSSAIHEASAGQGRFACTVGILDLNTGILQTVNCGLNHALFLRMPPKNKDAPANPMDLFKRLHSEAGRSLGEKHNPEYKVETLQLMPEDVISFATDGSFEVKNMKGERMFGVDQMKKEIWALIEKFGPQSTRICQGIQEAAQRSWGISVDQIPDDASTFVLAVPKKAYFLAKAA